jgi:hypothetical protein
MANGLKESTTWRDVKGNTARVSYYVSSGGTNATQATAAAAVQTAIIPLTNCAFQSAIGPATSAAQPVAFPSPSTPFTSVEDKAVFVFQDASGAYHRFQIPAPLLSIFLADEETVDDSNADVIAFNTAVITNVKNAFGDAMIDFNGAIRLRRKLRRKLNINVKDPSLTGPGE